MKDTRTGYETSNINAVMDGDLDGFINAYLTCAGHWQLGAEVIALRFARPEDAPALLEIYRPYVEETSITFETQVPSEAEFCRRITEISSQFPYLVAEESGVLLGYAYAHPFHERAAYSWTVESSIYVSQAHRGRHIGTMLYRALLSPAGTARGEKCLRRGDLSQRSQHWVP